MLDVIGRCLGGHEASRSNRGGGIIAIERMANRLKDDHANAKMPAKGLAKNEGSPGSIARLNEHCSLRC